MSIPTGYDTLGGVPFSLGCSNCDNYWAADSVSGNNPIILSVPAGQRIDSLFALVNTYWGVADTFYASIKLKKDGQNFYQKNLYGDTDIRDFHPNILTTTMINGTSTVNVFLSPQLNRLDMVKLYIPPQYQDSLIDSILFVDNGAHDVQRLVVSGLTLHVAPDSSVYYRWSTGDTTPSITANPVQTTTYYVTATTPNNNCSLTDSVTVVVIPIPDIAISAIGTDSICQGDSVEICAPGGLAGYLWSNNQTTSCIYASYPGPYNVVATDSAGCSAASNDLNIIVLSSPSISISRSGDTLTAYNANAYQWYLNNEALVGDTDSILIAVKSGTYNVLLSGANGCSAFSSGEDINLAGFENIENMGILKLYPDPSIDEINVIYNLKEQVNLQITVADLTGRQILNVLSEQESRGTYSKQIPTGKLSSGVYLLSFKTDNDILMVRFLKD